MNDRPAQLVSPAENRGVKGASPLDLPKRKRIRLEGYDYSQEGAYFITICTKDRKPLLGETMVVGDDAHIVPYVGLSFIGTVVRKYIDRIPDIDKYVIMPNHVHLLIVIPMPENGTMWAV